ncbi:Uncharacterised protein [Chlamydia trachomatis]|nr:Uncharacterised protein [Chlamydia trachomatis]
MGLIIISDDMSATTQRCGQMYIKQPTPTCSSAKEIEECSRSGPRTLLFFVIYTRLWYQPYVMKNSLEEREVAGKAL